MRALIGVGVTCLLLAGCGSDDPPARSAGAAGSAGVAGQAGAAGHDAGAGGSAGSNAAQSFATLPEPGAGVAFAPDRNGNPALFVALPTGGRVAKVDAAGAVGTVANVPSASALARRADDSLLITGQSGDASQDVVWLLEAAGPSPFAQGDGARPFRELVSIAISPDDRIVVSDRTGGAIFRLEADGSAPSIVTSLIPQPGPLAFSADGTKLYAVSGDTGAVWSVPRDTNIGNYGPPTELGGNLPDATSLMVLGNGDLLVVGPNRGAALFDPTSAETTQLASSLELGQPIGAAFGIDAFGDDLYAVGDSEVYRLPLAETGLVLPVR